MQLSQLADRIVASKPGRDMIGDAAINRDIIDTLTAGDLDCTQLDILTDMVNDRLNQPR